MRGWLNQPVTPLPIFVFLQTATVEQNFGKVNITESSSDGFYCDTVRFPIPFQSGGTIRVFPSLSHEDHPGNGNEASVAVVHSIDRNSFSVCLTEPAQPTGEMTLNWFAFSDGVFPLGILTGSVSYNAFTSGSVCNDLTFAQVNFLMLIFQKYIAYIETNVCIQKAHSHSH